MSPKITVKGTKVTIEFDAADAAQPSASGKTLVISSTRGNVGVDTKQGQVFVGLNVYKYATPKK